MKISIAVNVRPPAETPALISRGTEAKKGDHTADKMSNGTAGFTNSNLHKISFLSIA